MPAEADDVPGAAAPQPGAARREARRSSPRTARSPTPSSTTQSRALAARLVAAGVGKGARVGLLAPERHRVGGDRGRGACASAPSLVPLSTLLRPPELEAQLRVAASRTSSLAPSFRGRAYLDDLEDVAPGSSRPAGRRRHPDLPSLRPSGLDDVPPAPSTTTLVTRSRTRVRPADDLVVLFTSGSRGAPKGTIHTHGGALRAVAVGPRGPLHRRRATALYIPMPFFWTGGFSQRPALRARRRRDAAHRGVPEPERTLDLLERERVDAVPRLARPGGAARRRTRGSRRPTCRASARAACPPCSRAEQRPAPGRRANLFGMTETFGPYCGARLDLDLPAGARGSCGRPFDGFEVRIVDPETGATRAGRGRRDPRPGPQRDARHLRPDPRRDVRRRRLLPDRRPRRARCRRATSGTTAASTTCSR